MNVAKKYGRTLDVCKNIEFLMNVIFCISHFRALETAGKRYPLALYFSLNALTAINQGLISY